MIKPEELRIGNEVFDDANVTATIIAIEPLRVKLMDRATDVYYCNNKYINPIPLTEELLIRFGFEQGGYDLMEWRHEKHDRIWFVGIEDDCEDGTNEWLGWNYNMSDEGDALNSQLYITTVHQLQNLYFALTGEELELKDK